MALPLLLSACAVPVADFQVCSPFPGDYGASCDWFLHSDPQILTWDQWQSVQSGWINSGQAVECMSSGSIANIKKELEQLCSVSKCDYATQAAIMKGLNKIESLGVKK